MRRSIRLWEAIGSPANNPNYDARVGLGYGTDSGFHASRSYQTTYPYKEPVEDDLEEFETEFEIDDALEFRNKLGGVTATDPYASKSTDKQYYYGSATPSGMFGEAIVMNKSKGSISPFPNLYKRKEAVSGDGNVGVSLTPATIVNSRGSMRGWSRPTVIDNAPAPEDDKTLAKLKKLIRMYHTANLLRNDAHLVYR